MNIGCMLTRKSSVRGLVLLSLLAGGFPGAVHADFHGTVVSKSHTNRVTFGGSLPVTVIVRNSGSDDWEGGAYRSWYCWLWQDVPGEGTRIVASADSYAPVSAGAYATNTVTIPDTDSTMNSVGSYSVYLLAFYPDGAVPTNYYSMANSGLPVNFYLAALPPQISQLSFSNTTVTISMSNLCNGAVNYIQRCFDLNSNNWADVGSVETSGDATNWSETVSDAWIKAYYRVRSQ